MPLESGDQLGRYKINSLLGRGGMGEVYLAEDTRLGRTVALKVLPEDVSHNQQRLARFVREARAASALNHPNVAHIYEIEVAASPSFIAMEYVNGETLRERLSTTRMKLHEALDISVQATRAVAAAHAAGIVHRDIKTENIMISRDGYVKVLDFGLAKLAESSPGNPDPGALTVTSAHTDPGAIMGTVHYMSPEQARGLQADARTDLWGLGVVIYEMVTGASPFVGKTPSDVLSSILKDEPPPLARFNREAPEALEWIVAKALTKDVEGRYQTATELLTDLQRLKNRLGAEAEIERGSLADFRVSRSSYAGVGPSGLETIGGASADTNSQPRQSSAEYIFNGIKRHKKGALIALCALAGAVVIGVVALALLRNRTGREQEAAATAPQQPQQRQHVRLTVDAGLQSDPTWSPDGRSIAFSSNRSGNFEIWFQPTASGDPVQVTHSEAQDLQPDWQPNGELLVFRSERAGGGGGLYTIPFTGGNERKIASFGYRPRWSPDGARVLFLGPGQRLYDFPKLYFVTPGEDSPHEISTSFGSAEEGIQGNAVGWHPDSKRVSFLKVDGTFWTVPVTGGAPVKSELAPAVQAQLSDAGVKLGNFRWSPGGNFLYFEGTSRGVTNLWRITVEPETLRWVEGPERLTTGTGHDREIALSPDGKRLAYSAVTQSTRVWLLPFDADTGQIKGKEQAVTAEGMEARFSDFSPDGKKLVYSIYTYGTNRQELREKTLADGQDKVLAADNYHRYFPRWSPDSTRLAYSRFRGTGQQASSEATPPQGAAKTGSIFIRAASGGEEKPLTSQGELLDYMYDWSPDGEWVLASSNRRTHERWEVCLFPLKAAPHAETEMQVIASDPVNSLWTPRFSPDGKWICYIAQKPEGASVSVLYVIPAAPGGTPVRITGEGTWCDWPRWSPDGKTIYFVSNYESSFLNVWGIRFDPSVGAAAGEPFRVTNYDNPGQTISPKVAQMEMSLGKNRLALPITDLNGNIWMLENVDR